MDFATSGMLPLVAEANLAPSAHNTQPARWRFLPDGRCAVYEDRARRLTVADPAGRDAAIGVGAAIEGMALALGKQGLTLADGEPGGQAGDSPDGGQFLLRWTGRIGQAGGLDALSTVVELRATYRGSFEAPDAAARGRLMSFARTAADAVVVTDRNQLREMAAEHDAANLAFLRKREYRSELVSWMRFSAAHPAWSLDGLNAESMALSRVEAVAARCVLSDWLFPVLDGAGLARALLAEQRRILSAVAFVLFHRPASEQPLITGRRFYRLWLELTAAGFDLCPMSVLADDPATAGELCRRFGIAEDRRLVNVFRAGIRPRSAQLRRVRLPAASLLVPDGAATGA